MRMRRGQLGSDVTPPPRFPGFPLPKGSPGPSVRSRRENGVGHSSKQTGQGGARPQDLPRVRGWLAQPCQQKTARKHLFPALCKAVRVQRQG